jgi:hypothetical protein
MKNLLKIIKAEIIPSRKQPIMITKRLVSIEIGRGKSSKVVFWRLFIMKATKNIKIIAKIMFFMNFISDFRKFFMFFAGF